MVKAHLNKKRIRGERLKEERKLSEEQNNEDGQKKSQEVRETNTNENETQPANISIEKGNSEENKENEKEQKSRVTDLESDHKNVNEKEEGNPKAEQNNDVTGSPKVEQNNDVTSRDSNLNRLITTTVDPKQDQCVLNGTDYYLPIAREQRIKYKGLITIKEDPSPLNDKTSNNGVSIKTHSEENYQDLRSNLRDDENVKRSDNIRDENFKGGDRRQRVTTGVKLEPVRQRKARVLEVRKDTSAEPRVRERSSEQLVNYSSEQLNEKRKETSDDNHSGILTNPLHDVVTTKAQSNEACVIPSMTEDPNNRIVCVVTSLSRPKQSDGTGRQTGLIALSVTRRHKTKKPKSLRPIVPLPAITENEERGSPRKQPQDRDKEDRGVKNTRELTQPSKDGQNVKFDAQINNAPSFLPPLKLTNGKLEKRHDVNVTQDDNVLPRLTRSLDFVPGCLEHDDDIKTTAGSTQSLTAVELNSLRRKRERKMRKKILDEETVTVYQKNSKGQVVPSGIPFRRNVFAPPRDHEGRIRKRLVEAEQSVARQQKERMDTFFTQMVETGWFLYLSFNKNSGYDVYFGLKNCSRSLVQRSSDSPLSPTPTEQSDRRSCRVTLSQVGFFFSEHFANRLYFFQKCLSAF